MNRQDWYKIIACPIEKVGIQRKIFTLSEVKEIFNKNDSVAVVKFNHPKHPAIMFVNTSMFVYGEVFKTLPLIPITISIPIEVTPRENFKDGLIIDPEGYLKVFACGEKLIESVEQFVDHLETVGLSEE